MFDRGCKPNGEKDLNDANSTSLALLYDHDMNHRNYGSNCRDVLFFLCLFLRCQLSRAILSSRAFTRRLFRIGYVRFKDQTLEDSSAVQCRALLTSGVGARGNIVSVVL